MHTNLVPWGVIERLVAHGVDSSETQELVSTDMTTSNLLQDCQALSCTQVSGGDGVQDLHPDRALTLWTISKVDINYDL